ncbi:MAG: hypothetical protein MZV64_16675 [Ignavibacteriales bacterium]|nr:hypothetical protein [Ignavibacteriales bacterium]
MTPLWKDRGDGRGRALQRRKWDEEELPEPGERNEPEIDPGDDAEGSLAPDEEPGLGCTRRSSSRRARPSP